MKTQSLRVSHSYGRGTDADLELAAEAVHAHLYDNPAFPTPPVTAWVLDTAIAVFVNAMAAALHGETAAKAEKNNRREDLKALMKQLAFYVEEQCGNNRAKLLSSGFSPKSTNRTPAQAAQAPRSREAARVR